MRRYAFTLAELMVSVLVISIIMVVLAPVITKRFTSNSVTISQTKNESKLFLYDGSDSLCHSISGVNNAIECDFTVPQGVSRINALLVSAGGGGAGATTPTYEYGKKESVTSNTKEITITGNMKNVTVAYLAGSGGGGGGGAYAQAEGAAPTSQADCDPYDAKFLSASQNGGKAVCVTKYNIGDIPYATNRGISSGVMLVGASANCAATQCCWQGRTSGTCNSLVSSYSGCNRTVCTWHAGNNSCKTLAYNGTKAGDWRLPSNFEAAAWQANIKTINTDQGDNGLRLCDYNNGYGADQCYPNGYACTGSFDNECRPYTIWSSMVNQDYANRYELGKGVFKGPLVLELRRANSIRCVLEKTGSSYNSYAGGGGGGAPFFKNYPIPDSVITSNVGGRIVLYAASGGSGGAAASSAGSNASDGSNGNTSYVYVYNSSNVLKWGLKVPGGNGGKGASSTSYGQGGAQKDSNTCQMYDGSSWVAASCTSYGASGNSGTSASGTSTSGVGGTGGGSMYNTTSLSGGGSGGTSVSENGYQGSLWGAGGGGGTVRFQVSGSTTTPYRGSGGKGANGIAEIQYDLMYSAAGGGGGGGGAYALVKDISVTAGSVYKIRVAGGGFGGATGTSGSDGGTTSITFDSSTYSLSGGKGGIVGTSQSATNTLVQGKGGDKGIVSTNVSDKSNLKYKNGVNGSDANVITVDASNPYGGSYGGNGGTSGLDTKGGCGGLYVNSSICTNTGVNGMIATFVAPTSIETAQYGSAGSGGAGGGWSENTVFHPNPGGGSQGQNGYVYLYWSEN